MAKLKVLDASKAALFSFSSDCETTEAAQLELTARGWSNADALKHIDAALAAGAFRVEKSTRAESAKAETEDKK